MPRLVPPVLSSAHLPQAELSALRLDGELAPIGDCFVAIDEIVAPFHRGASLAAVLPPRLIAERMTAAWVLGAVPNEPAHLELCADITARYRSFGRWRTPVREVVMDDADTETHGGMRVTTAIRTALDLARVGPPRDEEATVIARLASIGRFTLDDCLFALDRRRNLPDKRQAVARLEQALQPPFTRYTS